MSGLTDNATRCLTPKPAFRLQPLYRMNPRLDLINQAPTLGCRVDLQGVSAGAPKRRLARVSQRVREGGHSVFAQRILERYRCNMTDLKMAVRSADLSFVDDAVQAKQGARVLVAICGTEQTTALVKKPPLRVTALLGHKYATRARPTTGWPKRRHCYRIDSMCPTRGSLRPASTCW